MNILNPVEVLMKMFSQAQELTQGDEERTEVEAPGGRFYYHFNNLRFKQSQDSDDLSAAPVVVYVVSSDIIKCRLLQ